MPAGSGAFCKNPDVTLQQIVVDRHAAVLCVACQIFPLIERVGDGLAKLVSGMTFGAIASSQALRAQRTGMLRCWRKRHL